MLNPVPAHRNNHLPLKCALGIQADQETDHPVSLIETVSSRAEPSVCS